MKAYLLRYSELSLKSTATKNRWLNILVKNIDKCLKRNSVDYKNIIIKQGRLIVYSDSDKISTVLSRLFGLVSYSSSIEVDLSIDNIEKEAIKLYNSERPYSFRITSQRITKDYCLTSQDINCKIGEKIVELGGKVNLTNPELNIFVEIINDKAYIFDHKIKCMGGLPAGVQGKVTVILDDERSVLSCLLMIKRGALVDLVIDIDNKYICSYINLIIYYLCGIPSIAVMDRKTINSFIKMGSSIITSSHPYLVKSNNIYLCPCELLKDNSVSKYIDKISNNYKFYQIKSIYCGSILSFNDNILLLHEKKNNIWVLPKEKVVNGDTFYDVASKALCRHTGLDEFSYMSFIGSCKQKDDAGFYEEDYFYHFNVTNEPEILMDKYYDAFIFVKINKAFEMLSYEADKNICTIFDSLYSLKS